ncbi:Bax inhibitor-1/YccA family protein [Asticcacaulis sp. DXS10W]|uniref:Bax inhibitor-1/YccA family protein n=1 Tax=Asticcacaulis currens TaxID=2984210 RepID=A0ABT5IAH4_9CAUL|nr:Bax inhibitor-1/YccA family protein [Asticcacaulis currens]MDC7693189.1 Bax inhibitor-1/YccA family protein [Asticcacaulis currens]
MQFEDTYSVSTPSASDMARDQGLKKFLLGIYQKMALGLVVTAAIAYAVANTPAILQLLYKTDGQYITGYTMLGYVFLFAPLGLSLISGVFMRELNAAKAGGFYWLFVAVMGVSLSSIAILYTGTSIAQMFLITAIAFGGLSLIGYTTKVNMTGWGTFLYMAVLGMIGVSLLNVFLFKSPMMEVVISAIGVLVFSGLIAFQTQSLKLMYYDMGGASQNRLAAMTYIGALGLYINFINLFLSLLRLFGNRN